MPVITPHTQSWALRQVNLALLMLCTTLAGCAGPNQIAARAPRIAFSDLDQGDRQAFIQKLSQPPYVVHFKAEQQIPFTFALESGLFEMEVPPLTITAKRDFYLLVRADGPPLLSEDGVDFKKRVRNSFMFGFSLKKDQPTEVQAKILLRPGS
jgi:hypothetical protein